MAWGRSAVRLAAQPTRERARAGAAHDRILCATAASPVSELRADAASELGSTEHDTDGRFVRYANVSKTYDGQKLVVDNLSFDVGRGEFLTMLGPSGSGKTTCLMMLAGFETPTSGDILLEGRSINDLPPYRRNIGMVFQNYALFPHLTVAENLAFPLTARRTARAEIKERVRRALEMVQLSGMEDRRPAQLSGGQQQRVAVARALIYQPKLVVMDEPLGALDKQLREQMQIELKRLHDRLGLTFIYVTHDQAEALTISDRIAVFDRGRIQQVATPSQIYEAPDSVFVAEFLGETNRLPGTVQQVAGETCRVELDNGDAVLAYPASRLAPGDRTILCLRPESVEMDPSDRESGNRYSAEILERIYLGDHLRIRVRVCGRDDFIIKVQRGSGAPSLDIGETCSVGWRSRDCRALACPSPA
ncbi:MAG: ABC transporter ATP-binding protein [Rhodospirillales bacterium]|nr:ABC transporter ATP-binding protein [Rhodospirillales bacterium]